MRKGSLVRTSGRRSAASLRLVPAMLLFLAAAVPAQEVPEDLTELSLSDLMDLDVVYGASNYLQKVSEAPASVTIVSGEEIRRYGYRTLAEVMNSVTGFYYSYDRNYHYLGVRGFSPPGDFNGRVLVLIDGNRFNENIFGGASLGPDFVLDLGVIDRIEVIRGPGSSVYGTSAFFGVINIITRNGDEVGGAEMEAQAGSYGTWAGKAFFGKTYESGLDVVVSSSVQHSDGQDLFFPEFDAPEYNGGVFEDGDAEALRNVFAGLGYGAFRLNLTASAREKKVPTGSFGSVFNDPRTRTEDRYAFADLSFRESLDGGWDLAAHASYNRYRYLGDYAYDYSEDDKPYIVVNKDEAVGAWWGGTAQITYRGIPSHALTAGTELRNNFRQDQRNYDEEVYLDDERSSVNTAGYLQDEFRPVRPLILNAGIRYDHSGSWGGSWNPRLGAILSLGEATSVKTLYGRAFRSPTAYELFYSDGEDTQKQSLGLGPETITTYEIVLSRGLGRNSSVIASGFHYRIRDLIVLHTDPEDDLLVFENSDEIRASGVEFEFRQRFGPGADARLSYAYQSSRNRTGDHPLPNSPAHMVKAYLAIPLLGHRFDLGTEALYLSKRMTLSEEPLKNVLTVNLTLSTRKPWRGVLFSGSVYNLFDERYENPGSEEHPEDAITQDGRNFRVSLGYRF